MARPEPYRDVFTGVFCKAIPEWANPHSQQAKRPRQKPNPDADQFPYRGLLKTPEPLLHWRVADVHG
jgi:hypothetical protein